MNDVIYLEADADITTAIDKIIKAESARVQVVVPKRSNLLASIVNLKLLKSAAKTHHKEVILVTTDKIATRLSGRVGLAVAEKLGSAPSIPDVPDAPAESEEVIQENNPDPNEPSAPTEPAQPSAISKVAGWHRKKIGDTPHLPQKASKILRIPDFNRLQKRVLISAGVILTVLALYIANIVLATAKVTLYAKGTPITADFDFTIDPDATQISQDQKVIPGQSLSHTISINQVFAATGQKDAGTKATGTITIKNCEDSSTHSFPAGSIVASQGKNFTTDTGVTIPAGLFAGGGTICNSQTVSVGITATQNGDSYNLAPTSYTSPSLSGNFKITGNQLAGGTTKNITVVAKADIDKATSEILDQQKPEGEKQLRSQTKDGWVFIAESFKSEPGSVTSEPGEGAEAGQATLTLVINYSALAVKDADFTALIKHQLEAAIGEQNQLYSDGRAEAKITPKAKSSARQLFNYHSTAYSGAKLDTTKVAKDLRGRRYGDAIDMVTDLPGVEKAEIDLWPGWNPKLPKLNKNIKIQIKVAESNG